MIPGSINALVIVALVIAPGYVFLWATRQKIRHFTAWSDTELVIATIASGTVMQMIAYLWPGNVLLRYFRNDQVFEHQLLLMIWIVEVVLFLPFALGYLMGLLINKYGDSLEMLGLDSVTRSPDAWGKCFSPYESVFLKIWLTDSEASVIGGKFGRNSIASNGSVNGDIYLEEQWQLDEANEFERPIHCSGGIWISSSNIYRVEFIKGVLDNGEDITVTNQTH